MQKQIEILSTQKNKIDKKIESLLYATAQSEELKLREIDILNEIKKADTELKEKYRTKEESALNKLSADQKETKSKTDKLLDKVKDFGKKLSLANPELGKNVEDIKSNLKIAGDSMDNASLNLKSADTGSALSKEAEALQHLSNSKEAFNSLMQGIESEGMSGAGKPQVRFLKPGQKECQRVEIWEFQKVM